VAKGLKEGFLEIFFLKDRFLIVGYLKAGLGWWSEKADYCIL